MSDVPRPTSEPAATLLIVDGMNVIGSRPNGWWRDRPAAVRALVARLGRYAEAARRDTVVVLDGREVDGAPAGQRGRLDVRYSGRRTADDCIVELVAAASAPRDIEVVTADRDVRARVTAHGASVLGPSALLRMLDESTNRGE